jgi:hypothetical protein
MAAVLSQLALDSPEAAQAARPLWPASVLRRSLPKRRKDLQLAKLGRSLRQLMVALQHLEHHPVCSISPSGVASLHQVLH